MLQLIEMKPIIIFFSLAWNFEHFSYCNCYKHVSASFINMYNVFSLNYYRNKNTILSQEEECQCPLK